jgi:hypothetical protein
LIGEPAPYLVFFILGSGRDANASSDILYLDYIQIIQKKILDTTNFMFKLACLMTPRGRIEACKQIYVRPQEESQADLTEDSEDARLHRA